MLHAAQLLLSALTLTEFALMELAGVVSAGIMARTFG
jgi:hypothetical protein